MSSLPPIGPAVAAPASRPPRSSGTQDDGFDLALGAACSAHAARPESAPAPPQAPDGASGPEAGHEGVLSKVTESKHQVEPHVPTAGPAVRLLPTSPRIEPAPQPGVAARPGPATGIEREPLRPVATPAAHADPPAKPAPAIDSHAATPAAESALEAIVVRGETSAVPSALAGERSERGPKGSREGAGRPAPETVSSDAAAAPARGASDVRVESGRGVASAHARAPRARTDVRASSGGPDATPPRTLPAGGLDAVAGDAAEPHAADATAQPRPLPDLPGAKGPATQATLVVQDEAGLDSRITVALRGDRLRTTIVTSHPEAAERLSGRLGELQQALAARGLEDAQISVRSLAAGTPHGGEDRGSRQEERPSPSSSRDPESHHPHGRTRQERRRDPSER